jgi:hypothetical protein
MLYRTGSDLSGQENYSPKKLIVNPMEHNLLNPIQLQNNYLNICITEDEVSLSPEKKSKVMKKQNSAKNSKKGYSGLFLSDSDNDKVLLLPKNNEIFISEIDESNKEVSKATKCIIRCSPISQRQTSASVN